ncbi:hypothetical protein phytr_4630 [Candidatus Phycorickettsia trachydisci]|uniref:Porin domain-containing protein n=1 Tax=Candidatus Phycorickettsia trachydisci TaxID=2115978 RepID=A0A2P1P817_9RICK|nr:porin [Candidatus Phycorickettsia trachydisci]AVP87412.1 hypothetical protein phytr_4630 [Candidatus Phycorickettsia trachydisci]
MKQITLILATSMLIAGSSFAAYEGHHGHHKSPHHNHQHKSKPAESKSKAVVKKEEAKDAVKKDEKEEKDSVTSPLKINALFDFTTGTRWQGGKIDNKYKKLTAHNKKLFFGSNASVIANIEQKTDDLTYGAKIVISTTAAPKMSASYNGSHLYIESADFGKIEAGAPINVNKSMLIDAGSVAANMAGASWSTFMVLNPQGLAGFDINNEDFYLSEIKSSDLGAVDREPSRKINYYTPKINGFQFGVTWCPDTTNGGSHKAHEAKAFNSRKVQYIDGTGNRKFYSIRHGATNAFALGATYEQQVNEDTSWKVALTGEFGKAIQAAAYEQQGANPAELVDPSAVNNTNDNILTGDHKLKNLKAYNIGAQVTTGKYSYAVSYGNLGKSFTSNNDAKFSKNGSRRSYFYSAAVAYTEGQMKVSLTYRGSSTRKNIANVFALGSDYQFKEGLQGYAELAYGYGKGRGKKVEAGQWVDARQKLRGATLLLGLRVKV